MSDDEPDDHRCRSGRWCVARSGRDPAVTSKPDTLCHQCVDDIQRLRDRIPALVDALKIFVGITPVSARLSKVSGSKEPSSPLNLAAESLLSDIGEVVSRCGNYLIRDLVSRPAERFTVWRGDVEQQTFFDGVALALQVRSVCRRAEKLVGFDEVWQRRHAVCPSCGMPCLGQFSGSEVVQCSGCGHAMTDRDYQDYCVGLMKGR